jgi:hypothetical protein
MTISCTPVLPFYRLLEFCMLLNPGYLAWVLIAEPCIRNTVPFGGDVPHLGKRVISVVVRGEQAFASIACSTSFRFRDMRPDFKASSRLESLFRALSSPPDLASRLAQGGKRRGTEEVQRARTGRTDRRFANDERNDSVARNGDRKESFF